MNETPIKSRIIKRLSPSQKKGQHFEHFAEHYLKNRGLKLVARNYSCRFGEIDLIMRDGESLVFVEVRYRKNPLFGTALDSITPTKQKKISKTAQHYLQTHDWTKKLFCRFDALGIIGAGDQDMPNKDNHKAEWIKDAFSPYW